jgi:hypothetical protein
LIIFEWRLIRPTIPEITTTLVDKGEAIIKHLETKDMYANVLTKPLQGSQFFSETDAHTGLF